MLLSDFSIKRPVFSISLSIIIMLIGIFSLLNLSLQQYPRAEEPILTIRTEYYGASSSLVESKVQYHLKMLLIA